MTASVRETFSMQRIWRSVFRIDVSVCPDCGGRMRMIAALTEPASIRRYLQALGMRGAADRTGAPPPP